MKITYRPKGVCSQLMDIEVEDGKIESVKVTGGCSGNLQGISSLRGRSHQPHGGNPLRLQGDLLPRPDRAGAQAV